MRTSETLSKIAPALVAALAEIEGAAKKGDNPHFKSKFATLEAVIEASREVLATHELTLMQFPGALTEGKLTLETVIMHTSGEYVSSDFQIALGKNIDPQGVGSALTYARRYAQKAALNMPDVDDDGEAAVGRPAPPDGQSEPIQQRDLGVAPDGKDFWKCEGPGPSVYQAKKDGQGGVHERMREEIRKLHTDRDRREWIDENLLDIQKMPRSWRVILRSEIEEQANISQGA